MTIRRFLFRSSGVVAAIVAVAWFWLLHTESGMHWLWNQARGAIAGELDARSVSGDLGRGVALRHVTLHTRKLTVTVDRIDVTIDFDILPLSLEIETLKLETMLVHLSDDNSSASNLEDRRQVLESLSLPVRLFVSDANIDDLSIEGLVKNRHIYLETLSLRAEMKDQLHVDRLRISAAEGSADVSASLNLRRPFSSSIAGQIELQPLLTGYDKTIEANLSASGNLTAMAIVIDTAGLDTHLEGSIGNLLTGPAWDLSLDVPAYGAMLSDSQSLRAQDIAVTSAGTINQYSLQASARLELSGFEPAVVSAIGSGSLHAINVSSLAIENELFSVSATGEAHWAPSAKLVADVQLDRLSPRMFVADWPAAESVSGHVSLQLDGHRVLLQDATLRIADQDTLLNFSASVELETTRVESQLEWRNVRWRADETTPPIISKWGSAVITGTLDDWKLRCDIGIQAAEFPAGNFVLTGAGNRESVALQIEKGDVFGGSALGKLEFSWIDEQSVAADLSLNNVSAGNLFPEWPGIVTGSISVDGQLQPLRLNVSLEEMAGTLRGRSLSASGDGSFGSDELLFADLNIAHGTSRARLNGSLFTPEGLTFDFVVSDLGGYLDDFHGPLNAAGKLSLAGNTPAFQIDASSDAIGYLDYLVGDLKIHQQENESQLITANALSMPAGRITDIAIRTSLSPDEQAIRISANAMGILIDVSLIGAFDDWQQAGRSPWNGRMQSLQLSTENHGRIELLEPAGLTLSTATANIEPLCVGYDDRPFFCAEGSWEATGALHSGFDLKDVPVDLVNMMTPTGFEFDQLLSGSFAWQRDANQRTSGRADFSISPGTFRDRTDSSTVINTGSGDFSFDVQDGRLLTGTIDLPMPGTGAVSGRFSMLDVSAGTASPVAGNLDITIESIEMIAALLPVVDEASGNFDANMSLSGTIAAPHLAGAFNLGDGKLDYRPLGLAIDGLQLSGKFHDDQSVAVDGRFRAGDGLATMKMRSIDGWSVFSAFEIELQGDDLTLISVPDVQAVADVDLRARYDGSSLELGGKVFVPQARITPKNLSAERVSESTDVVIVAGSLSDSEDIEEQGGALNVRGEIEIALGKKVVIDLGIAKANVSGDALFTWAGEPIPLANGRYDLQGDIRAFGQVLEIAEGSIRFPNIPANNPFIRVRAEREIFGNSQIKRAGVLVDGTARRQTIEAYTNPPSSEERALTLLVTGSDFDLEQGIGAIGFGTYIAPKLFVSYAIGLFESANVISARYDLKKGFGVKATSGERSSGLDFIYRIDR